MDKYLVVFLESDGISIFYVDVGIDFSRNSSGLGRSGIAVDSVRVIVRMGNDSSLDEARTKEAAD